MKLLIDFESRGGSTGGHDPNDSWSRDSTWTEWTAPNTAQLVDESRSGFYVTDTEEVGDDIHIGDIIHMVWVQYSTGDSFGRDEGAYHEIIGLYKTAELADKARKAIEDDRNKPYEFGDGGNRCEVPTFDGSGTRPVATFSWKGYFESLDRVEVDVLRVI